MQAFTEELTSEGIRDAASGAAQEESRASGATNPRAQNNPASRPCPPTTPQPPSFALFRSFRQPALPSAAITAERGSAKRDSLYGHGTSSDSGKSPALEDSAPPVLDRNP
jgi:hypothetical protein